MTRLLTIDVRDEQAVVVARQRTRQVAELLGFDAHDQTRLATAVSELARNAVQYAGGGRIEFAADGRGLAVTVRDQGPGFADPQAVLDGRAPGAGLTGARRMVDEFAIESVPGNTAVRLGKALPRGAPALTGAVVARIADELTRRGPAGPLSEANQQNRELLHALGELCERENRLTELNGELEATNKGVVALYAELEEKAESLRRASELKTRFLSNMSHEFRTPLNSIISLARFLLDRTDGPLTEEQERQVTFVFRAATGLSELVNDLLDLAKIEAGKVTVRVEEFSAADLFATLRGLMRPLHTNDAVALTFEDAAAVGGLCTDEGKVAQILRNFLSNALKFTERGEDRVTAEARPDGTVVFAVSDTGIGIAPADQSRIFEEFGQVENRFQKRVKGTGLGLSLSKRLAELLGGSVGLKSEPGIGSTFSLTVPRAYPGATPPPVRRSGSGERVLVIDDDVKRYTIVHTLRRAGFHVEEGTRGADALRMAPSAALLVLDVKMPDLNGFDVCRRLKGDPARARAAPVGHVRGRGQSGGGAGERRRRVPDQRHRAAGARGDGSRPDPPQPRRGTGAPGRGPVAGRP